MENYLTHHGIKGQQWGVQNGPPYPLKGGNYSKAEIKEVTKERLKNNSIYNKKHFDKVIKEGTKIVTLSYDPNRTKEADMFYAAYDEGDKHQYNTLFNKKIPQDIYDEAGNKLGTGNFYKYRITNVAKNDIKVASEDSGIDAFLKLYSNNKDFYNFILSPTRMESHFVDDKYKFKGYREAKEALARVRKADVPTEDDLRIVYRTFNYVIPSDGKGDKIAGNDIAVQRAKLFKELKNEGYGALLDTNDTIYGAYKTNSSVILFDPNQYAFDSAVRVNELDKLNSELLFIGKKALGL